MAKKETRRAKRVRQISELLGDLLDKPCDVDDLEGYDEVLTEIGAGTPAPKVAELLAKKIVSLALDSKKTNQWAIEMLLDRTEGKSVQGKPKTDDGRQIEEKLSDISIKHLNQIAGTTEAARPAGPAKQEAKGTKARPVSRLVALPKNGPTRT